MTGYENKQTGSKLILSMVAVTGVIAIGCLLWGMYYCPGRGSCPVTEKIGPLIIITTSVIILYAFLMLSSMTVKITDSRLKITFGPGLLRKTIDLEEAESAGPVRNTFAHGWGIHYHKGATVCNIAGFDAVEISFKSGKRTRIGTDEPAKLAEAVKSVINRKNS